MVGSPEIDLPLPNGRERDKRSDEDSQSAKVSVGLRIGEKSGEFFVLPVGSSVPAVV